MSALSRPVSSIRDAYDQWAQDYPPKAHNPLMRLEQRVMTAHMPAVQDQDVLDMACGTGRYATLLRAAGARTVVALDFSNAMLQRAAVARRVQGDMTRLPFQDHTFDLVVSGLAIGHAPDICACVEGIARVLRKGGSFVYSDFHPLAEKAGLTRSWTVLGETYTVPGSGYPLAEHRAALKGAGFEIEMLRELRVGFELNERFDGCGEFYRRWHGVPLVFVVRAHR